MRIAENYCDPDMFKNSEATGNSVGDIFEQHGIPMTRCKNDRTAAGYAISEWLNTTLEVGLPKLQIVSTRCPILTNTLPEQRIDPKNAGRLADGNDHAVISLSYFCMAATGSPRVATVRRSPTRVAAILSRITESRPHRLGVCSQAIVANKERTIVYGVQLHIMRFGLFVVPLLSSGVVASQNAFDADQVIQQLSGLPDGLPGTARSDGSPDPIEQRREYLWAQLRSLGDGALPAIAKGFESEDVSVRRNLALSVSSVVDQLSERGRRKLIQILIDALDDADPRVRGLSAQRIGGMGPAAASAVPALVRLLREPYEGSRNSACIGLRGIGPGAKAALPALREALNDPSQDVQRFAQRAIDSIQSPD
jgi:hypothetical protein